MYLHLKGGRVDDRGSGVAVRYLYPYNNGNEYAL